MVKKVYKSDLGSLAFVGFGVLIFFALTLFSFLAFEGAPLKVKLSGIAITVFSVTLLFLLLKYKVIIADNSISSKIFVLSFLDKYRTMKFEEIKKVYNAVGPYSDMQKIIFESRDKTKKPISIMVGFGLPWSALIDILQYLPENTEINFEPLLWKKIKNPPKADTPKRIFIFATVLIFIIFAVFYYSWRSAFK